MSHKLLLKSLQLVEQTETNEPKKNHQVTYSKKEKRKRKAVKSIADNSCNGEDLLRKNLTFLTQPQKTDKPVKDGGKKSRHDDKRSRRGRNIPKEKPLDTSSLLGHILAKKFRESVDTTGIQDSMDGGSDFAEGDFDFGNMSEDDDEEKKTRKPIYKRKR